MTIYILADKGSEPKRYWKIGAAGGFTLDLADARQYARKQSALNARLALIKYHGLNPETFVVEAAEA